LDADIFLLDIFMPELNGIDIARELKDLGTNGKIIFITGGNDYITEAFEIHAFSYIQKPVEYEKFAKVMNAVVHCLEKARYIDIIADREKRRVYLADILYVETLGRRLVIYTKDEELETYLSVKNFMDEYGGNEFLQISRYAAVSKSRIQRIVGRSLYLMNGKELLVSEKYLPTTKKLHIEYIHTKKVANV
jgi:possible two-component response regulator